MRVEDNIVILEPKDCTVCTHDSRIPKGQVIDRFEPMICPKCNGTGRRGSGRCRECNSSSYFADTFPRTPGYVPNYNSFTTRTCSYCNGNYNNAEQEDLTDRLPIEIIREIPIEVHRRPNRAITFNEANLGFGTIYSVVNYGRSREWTDEQFVAKVHESPNLQACNYANRETHELCKKIVIVTSDQGFSAWPTWEVTT